VIGRSVSYFLLALLGLEVALRLAGYFALLSSKRDVAFLESNSSVRILALGESTTSNFFSQVGSWPEKLEDKLRQAGVNARVFNEGLPATTTAMILANLPGYLEKYNPDIVISMMGVNDGKSIEYDGSALSSAHLFVSNIRLLKLADLIWERLRALYLAKMDYAELSKRKDISLVKLGFELAGRGAPMPEVERAILARAPGISDLDMAINLTEISLLLGDYRGKPKNLEQAFEYNRRAFELFPFNRDVACWFIAAVGWGVESRRIDKKVAFDAVEKLLECGNNLPDDLLSMMAEIAVLDPKLAEAQVFRDRGLRVGLLEYVPTRRHYRIMHQILKDRGIKLVAMQYPTLKLEELQAYFKDKTGRLETQAEDIFFVSNRDNFVSSLESKKYEEIFVDRFRGSWGHTTDFGYELLADSAFRAVMRLLDSQSMSAEYGAVGGG
jgi:hypothetical protein